MEVIEPLVICDLHGRQPCVYVCPHVEHAQRSVHRHTAPTPRTPGEAVCEECGAADPKLRPMCAKCADVRIGLCPKPDKSGPNRG
jgi:hypothetical protein